MRNKLSAMRPARSNASHPYILNTKGLQMLAFLSTVADCVYRCLVLSTLLTACTHLQKIDRVVQRLDTVSRHTAETARLAGAMEQHLAHMRAEQSMVSSSLPD